MNLFWSKNDVVFCLKYSILGQIWPSIVIEFDIEPQIWTLNSTFSVEFWIIFIRIRNSSELISQVFATKDCYSKVCLNPLFNKYCFISIQVLHKLYLIYTESCIANGQLVEYRYQLLKVITFHSSLLLKIIKIITF